MEDPHSLVELYLTGRLRDDQTQALRDWLTCDRTHLKYFLMETSLNRGIYDILISERRQAEECKPSNGDHLLRIIAQDQDIVESASRRKGENHSSSKNPNDLTFLEMATHGPLAKDAARIVEEHAKQQLAAFLAEQEKLKNQKRDFLNQLRPLISFDLRGFAAKVGTFSRVMYKTSVAVSVLFLFGLVVTAYVHDFMANRVVAKLGDCRTARWTTPPEKPELRRGSLSLEEGWAQVKFLGGAEVLLQAPCRFELRSSKSMFLENGTLSAKITTPDPQAITIDTPNSQLVDFGTEFGVLVDGQGESQVHVFDGRVRIEAKHSGNKKERFQDLTEGRGARVDNTGTIIRDNSTKHLFSRSLPEIPGFGIPGKRLDLSDLLGGGNGFGTGRLMCAIDPLTGLYAQFDPFDRNGQGTYKPVRENLFIDGLFAPHGGAGRVVITSSKGHIFQECPETDGRAFGSICNTLDAILYDSGMDTCRPSLGDQVYDTAAHPSIYLHANAGITFDLGAIRDCLTGDQIRRFTARCGVCADQKAVDDPVMDFWVLIDGKVRFGPYHAAQADGPMAIDVPLSAQDRFLTLLSTEGPDGPGGDVGLFAEPALELGVKDEENDEIVSISSLGQTKSLTGLGHAKTNNQQIFLKFRLWLEGKLFMKLEAWGIEIYKCGFHCLGMG